MIETSIYQKLESSVGTLLGDTGGAFSTAYDTAYDEDDITSRIYPTYPAQDVSLPFAVYTVTSSTPVYTLHGPTGSYEYGFNVDVYAITFSTALQIAQAIRAALDGWASGSVKICVLQSASSTAVSATGGSEAYLYTLTFSALGAI